nr:hypothetical protein [Tanacetum cinerariifolium]
ISELPSCVAVTPNEPVDSLIMGDEHLKTIPATESDEFIKSCVENLVPNLSESEDKNGCDMPPERTTFLRVLCDAECESDSSDDQSPSDEDVLETIISKPLCEEEIIPIKSLHDDDSERDIPILDELLDNYSLSLPKKESFHSDIPPFSRPPAKPPDGNTGILNIKMMGDISDQKAFMHKLMITLASHQEKSPDLLSHQCGYVKKFNTHRSHLNTSPMMIHRQNNHPLDVLLFHFYPH